jgi:phosphatidylserine/phosphatidylglycerophosphate/cardiolipin synthase-like enzyme
MSADIYMFLPPLPAGAPYYREAHPYGPDGSGGFNTDLAILIDPAHLSPYAKALAIVDGLIRFVPDSSSATGTLVLKPAPDVMGALGKKLDPDGEISSLVFIYRNLDATTVMSATLARGLSDSRIFVESPEEIASLFAAGSFFVSVRAGDTVGMASPLGGMGGWAQLGFEICYVPRGLLDTPRGLDPEIASSSTMKAWGRLKELLDPTDTSLQTRRLDPMAFYAALVSGRGTATLAAAHANHILLSLPTRRTLIEIRDEYDRPWESAPGPLTDSVTIKAEGGATITALPAPGAWGTFVQDSGEATGPASDVKYTVTIPNRVLTSLPSGSSVSVSAERTMSAPAHWALQAIFMAQDPDSADEDKSWFIANEYSALPRYRESNKVTAIRDGIPDTRDPVHTGLLPQYADAMSMVTRPGHFMYLAGWVLKDGFPLKHEKPDTTVKDLMKAAAEGGAAVRALLFDGLGNINSDQVTRIQQLPGDSDAILDNEIVSPFAGHHQKCLVIHGEDSNGTDKAIAFCGGIDINDDRQDSPLHGAEGAFHDIHAKVEGPGVEDIHRCFVDRWNNHPDARPKLPESAPPFDASAGSVYVQVACTYAPKKKYPWVDPIKGSLMPRDAFLQAIKKAKKYIYIEDQYLTPYPGENPYTHRGSAVPDDTVKILNALRNILPNIDYLLILIPNHADLPQNRFRRQQFIEGLRTVDKEKVHVFFLGREYPASKAEREARGELAVGGGLGSSSGGLQYRKEIYVHSKIWIVDDVCAKIGSSNCSRRSYTADTEMDLILVDGAIENGARTFVRRFRMDLWGEHLNLKGASKALLEDHMLALQFWLDIRPPGHRIRPYMHMEEIESVHSQVGWEVEDLDGR